MAADSCAPSPPARPPQGTVSGTGRFVAEAGADAGDRPLELLDALVHDPDGDFDYRMYIGAGPLEDLLNLHAGRYADALAERCRCDELWADALRGVWVDRALWSALPEELRRVVPEPRPVRSRTRPSSRPRSRREWS